MELLLYAIEGFYQLCRHDAIIVFCKNPCFLIMPPDSEITHFSHFFICKTEEDILFASTEQNPKEKIDLECYKLPKLTIYVAKTVPNVLALVPFSIFQNKKFQSQSNKKTNGNG